MAADPVAELGVAPTLPMYVGGFPDFVGGFSDSAERKPHVDPGIRQSRGGRLAWWEDQEPEGAAGFLGVAAGFLLVPGYSVYAK